MARPGGPTAAMHDAIRIKKADEPSERTLDMLDELIGTIHRSRLATFAARSRKHEKRMKRRAEQLSNATASRHRNNANLQFVNEQMADEEDDRILEDLSSNFSVPVSAPAPLRKVLPKAQLFTGKAETFNRLENIDGDLQAARIFDEFRVELQQFVQNDPIRRNSVEGRGDFADYLVEKYLSQVRFVTCVNAIPTFLRTYIPSTDLPSETGPAPSQQNRLWGQKDGLGPSGGVGVCVRGFLRLRRRVLWHRGAGKER